MIRQLTATTREPFGQPPPVSTAATRPKQERVALVVFVDQAGLLCLRWLRKGFRHCFVIVRVDRGWIACDPMSHRTDLDLFGDLSPDQLAHWYRSLGLNVVRTRIRSAPLRLAPVRPYTCVEAVKHVLGLHAPWTLTPWQLYKRLHHEDVRAD